MKNILVSIISLMVFISCNPSELSKDEYLNYVKTESNGLIQRERVSKEDYIFIYRPTELVAIEQCQAEIIGEKCDLRKLINENQNFKYFNLIIKDQSENGEVFNLFKNSDLYTQKLEHMVSEMKQDFVLIEGSDTLSCVLFNFEPPFKASSELRFALGFERKSQDKGLESMQLIFNDHVLDNGIIKCNYDDGIIKSIPKLKMN